MAAELTDDELLEELRPKAIEQAMIKTIMANIKPDTLAFENRGMFTCSVLRSDGSYRSKSIPDSTDFALTGVKVGARSQLIFCFRPIDPADDYTQIELDEKKVFDVFDGLSGMVITALGYEPGPVLVGTGTRTYSWDQAKAAFKKSTRDRVRTAQADEKKKIQQEKISDYAGDPNFGSW
jgi:hypothetical protein